MRISRFPLVILRSVVVNVVLLSLSGLVSGQGIWKVLLENAGISSMHAAITHYNTAIFLDRTNIGPSQIKFTNGYCRNNPNDKALQHDCTAHSVMFDPSSNTVRPLTILTDTWCSSGQFFANGTMVQTGGDLDGRMKIRILNPCAASGSCDWIEMDSETLTESRWYATNQLLPDGRQIVVGGRSVFSFEFVPKQSAGEGSYAFSFLQTTADAERDNLYPFVHLLPDGNLFIFANRDAVLLDYKNNAVLKKYPTIPGEPRNYPAAGSSVLLPLDQADGFSVAEVLVCGGAHYDAFNNPTAQYPASKTCGRIVATAFDPHWSMETMPMARVMGDMVILPSGDVLIINGAENGSQGWNRASNPVFTPVTYSTYRPDSRFKILAPTTIPRLYHSTANLLADGRILVAGSNTHQFYTFSGEFPTELRVEAFSPPYLESGNDILRPTIYRMSTTSIKYGSMFEVVFAVPKRQGLFELNLLSSPFTTHSYSQGQRMLKLEVTVQTTTFFGGTYATMAKAPPSAAVAPASYYLLWPVQDNVPGKAVWIQVS